MREFENKEIGSLRFEFTDGTVFVLEPMNLKHVSYEAKNELDLTISRILNQIEEKRIKQEGNKGGSDLGIDTGDNVGTKDKMV